MSATKKAATPRQRVPKPAKVEEPAQEEVFIRVAFTADDLFELLQQLEGWDNPIAHRLRLRLSKHRLRHPR